MPLVGLLSTASNLGPLWHNNSAELRAEQRARRAHIQTARVRAMLTHVGAHQPAEVLAGFGAGAITRALKLRQTQSTGVAHSAAATGGSGRKRWGFRTRAIVQRNCPGGALRIGDSAIVCAECWP